MGKKHAYMIICHNHFEQLKSLLRMIDDERNDIYLHVDKKCRKRFPYKEISASVIKGRLYYVKSVNVVWGSFSLVQAELSLLKVATQAPHDYYHLLSGADLPIKTQDEIYSFFEENQGEEYIEFADEKVQRNFLYRVKYFHLLQHYIGNEKSKKLWAKLLRTIEHKIIRLQEKCHVNRIKGLEDTFYKGGQWFSITHNMAEYILQNERFIKKYFCLSNCSDEAFVQTVSMKSPYKDHIVNDSLRLIDWNRGTPYVFRQEDLEAIKESEKIFARKFDESVDKEVITEISRLYSG